MNYLSVCSGIEAATCAWHALGWTPRAFSEIEKFPSQVLAHHYPDVPNLGDMTNFKEWSLEPIDLLVGGTPCQSFSVAGLRKGLDDPRGNLMLTYLAIAELYKPRWLVWENVPGVLSSNRGRDFGTFLGALGKLGYGFAYRVLDAQYFGVAQRRRRVFVVGYLGDWRRAAAVLFERESLSGHPAPSREEGEKIAEVTPFGIGERGEIAHCLRAGASKADKHESTTYVVACSEVAPTLNAAFASKLGLENQHINGGGDCSLPPVSMCLNAGGMGRQDAETETLIPTRGGGFDVAHSLPIAFGAQNSASQDDSVSQYVTPTLDKSKTPGVQHDLAVRRLTPRECERLQGFPDGFTQIPYRNKPADKCPDGPRYKALGNSMAVPVMRWIGERISEANLKEKNT